MLVLVSRGVISLTFTYFERSRVKVSFLHPKVDTPTDFYININVFGEMKKQFCGTST